MAEDQGPALKDILESILNGAANLLTDHNVGLDVGPALKDILESIEELRRIDMDIWDIIETVEEDHD